MEHSTHSKYRFQFLGERRSRLERVPDIRAFGDIGRYRELVAIDVETALFESLLGRRGIYMESSTVEFDPGQFKGNIAS